VCAVAVSSVADGGASSEWERGGRISQFLKTTVGTRAWRYY
jgi:hypothetical protein